MDSPTKSSEPTESKARQLARLYARYEQCKDCSLNQNRKRLMRGVGNPESAVVFLLDRFSVDELQRATFLTTSSFAGVLNKVLSACGRQLEDYWCTPVVACPTLRLQGVERPPEICPTPKTKELVACAPRLYEELRIIDPAIVIALGGQSARMMLPQNTPSMLYHQGEVREAMIPGEWGRYCVPVMVSQSLHTLYTRQSDGVMWERAVRHINMAINIAEYLRS